MKRVRWQKREVGVRDGRGEYRTQYPSIGVNSKTAGQQGLKKTVLQAGTESTGGHLLARPGLWLSSSLTMVNCCTSKSALMASRSS